MEGDFRLGERLVQARVKEEARQIEDEVRKLPADVDPDHPILLQLGSRDAQLSAIFGPVVDFSGGA